MAAMARDGTIWRGPEGGLGNRSGTIYVVHVILVWGTLEFWDPARDIIITGIPG